MAEAAAECAEVKARSPGGGAPDWDGEVTSARRLAALATRPHQTRAERRRAEQKARKAAGRRRRTGRGS